MPKFNLQNIEMKDLLQSLVSIQDESVMLKFLEDLCTRAELEAMVERLEIARQLNQDKSYREVSKQVGASTTTVSRVARSLHHGQGGYLAVMGHLH